MTRPDGVPVNAVFGFTNMLARLLKDRVGTHFAVIFDAGRLTFRNRLYDLYKAQRPEPPEELRPQFALVREATAAFGVPAIELADWEADDLIASYARAAEEAGGRTTIVSSDKDLMQLIRPGVDMLEPIKQKPIGPAEVVEKWGVPPDKLVEVQALMGDTVDNVPGVPGIGPKTAAALITEFGDLESVLAAAPAMKPSKKKDMLIAHAEAARLSRRLVVLSDDAPLPVPLSDLAVREPDRARLASWLTEQGFRSTLVRLGLEAPGAVPSLQPARGGQGALAFADPPAPAIAPLVPGEGYGPYVTVTTIDALQSWIAEATAAGIVALDTETDGLDAMRANLVGFSLAIVPGRACYVPLRHADAEGTAPEQVPAAQAIAALAPLLTDPAVLKVFLNAKFDMLVLSHAGAPRAAPQDDVMLISYAQDAGRHGHGMDELALLHLHHSCISYDQVTGTGRARLPFGQVPLDRATPYAAEDADVTLRLWQHLRPTLRSTGSLALV